MNAAEGYIIKLKLKVVPNSSSDKIGEWLGEALKIKVKAPPETGKANLAVEKLIASTLNIPVSKLRIISGHTSSNKTIEIDDLSMIEIQTKLEKLK